MVDPNDFELNFDALEIDFDAFEEAAVPTNDALDEGYQKASGKAVQGTSIAYTHGKTLADYAELPVHTFGAIGAATDYMEFFLPAVKADYYAQGCGTYKCVLQWEFKSDISVDTVERFFKTVRTAVARLRTLAKPDTPRFFVTMLNIEILDNKHAMLNAARMNEAVYNEYERRRQVMRHAAAFGTRRTNLLDSL